MKRTAEVKRVARPKKSNRKRSAKAFRESFGSDERADWVSTLSCCVCQKAHLRQTTRTENAHTEGGGMGKRGKANTICPLCAMHHRELHQHGAQTFALRWRIDLKAEAAKTAHQWDRLNPEGATDE